MAEIVRYECSKCHYSTAFKMGKCPECESFGTLEKVTVQDPDGMGDDKMKRHQRRAAPGKPRSISDVDKAGVVERVPTGIGEFDRVIGGGLVRGMVTLVSGAPGIGKSTLLLQLASKCAERRLAPLYVSAEESEEQISLRGKRLKVSPKIMLYGSTSLEQIVATLVEAKPAVAIVDSIQMLSSGEVSGAAGTVSQIRECANILANVAKAHGIALFIVGHITKDGNVAGPKLLEHIVDAVLVFEGDEHHFHRLLYAEKNRYGSTEEVGIFQMAESGLEEVPDPTGLFLTGRRKPGVVLFPVMEGRRPLVVEVQALLNHTQFTNPRRTVNGVDYNRVLQLIAVIEKYFGVPLGQVDVFVNVSGGLKVKEPAVDLAIVAAILSSLYNKVPETEAFFGEVSLVGDVMPAVYGAARTNELKARGVVGCTCNEERGAVAVFRVRAVEELKAAFEPPKAARRK